MYHAIRSPDPPAGSTDPDGAIVTCITLIYVYVAKAKRTCCSPRTTAASARRQGRIALRAIHSCRHRMRTRTHASMNAPPPHHQYHTKMRKPRDNVCASLSVCLSIYISLYLSLSIYLYVCVCVCMCVCLNDKDVPAAKARNTVHCLLHREQKRERVRARFEHIAKGGGGGASPPTHLGTQRQAQSRCSTPSPPASGCGTAAGN